MQFIHEDSIHFNVRSETPALHDPATRQMVSPKRRRVYVDFVRGAAPAFAVEFAKTVWPEMRKKPAEISYERWLAFYDSVQAQNEHGWTDEEREAIESKLAAQGYVQVSKPKLPAPYPKYDTHRKTAGKRTLEHVIRDISAAFESTGFDVDLAVAYEAENGGSAEVIEALKALGAPETADEEQVIAA